nr:poly [ADP-ribose] polymerase 1 isoform X2 [Ipomoea trifida]
MSTSSRGRTFILVLGLESSWLAPRDASRSSSRAELILALESTVTIASLNSLFMWKLNNRGYAFRLNILFRSAEIDGAFFELFKGLFEGSPFLFSGTFLFFFVSTTFDCSGALEQLPKRNLYKNQHSQLMTRRKNPATMIRNQSFAKTEPNAFASDVVTKSFELESQLNAQSKALWALKYDLKKHVSTELREMLECNDYVFTGLELDLRDQW